MTTGIDVNAICKASSFDPARIERMMAEKTQTALHLASRFVAQHAKHSMRYRRRASNPGDPPSAHEGSLRDVAFAFDSSTGTYVIGPAYRQFNFQGGLFSRVPIPEVLEFGNVDVRVVEKRWRFGNSKWRRADLRRKENKGALGFLRSSQLGVIEVNEAERGGRPMFVQYRARSYTLAARPFMGPALMEELPKFEGLIARN